KNRVEDRVQVLVQEGEPLLGVESPDLVLGPGPDVGYLGRDLLRHLLQPQELLDHLSALGRLALGEDLGMLYRPSQLVAELLWLFGPPEPYLLQGLLPLGEGHQILAQNALDDHLNSGVSDV